MAFIYNVIIKNISFNKNKKYNLSELLKEDILLEQKPLVTRNNFNDYLKENNSTIFKELCSIQSFMFSM